MNVAITLVAALLTPNVAFSATCTSNNAVTVCENVQFSPETTLNTVTNNKLVIRNATGAISTENLSSLKHITELTITTSDLNTVETGTLCSLPKLNSLIVYNNKKFPHITKSLLKNCQNLNQLYVDGHGQNGGVQVEEGAFTECDKLHILTLNDTVFGGGDGVIDVKTFQGLDMLEALTIQHSTLRDIRVDTFNHMKSLKFLDLLDNELEEIRGGVFRNLAELTVLNLSGNKVKNLTWDEFDGLKSLKVLFLERNEFRNVDVQKLLKHVPNLNRIFLSYDKLTPESIKDVNSILPKHKITVIFTQTFQSDHEMIDAISV